MGLVVKQIRLMQIKAVIAINIALGSGRFVHRMEAIMPAGRKSGKFEFRGLHRIVLFVDFGNFIALNANPGHEALLAEDESVNIFLNGSRRG